MEEIFKNIDKKKEEAKKVILAKFALDEETAQLAVNSLPLSILNDLDKVEEVMESFIAHITSKE